MCKQGPLCLCDNIVFPLLRVPIFSKASLCSPPQTQPSSHRMDRSRGLTRTHQRQINELGRGVRDEQCRGSKTRIRTIFSAHFIPQDTETLFSAHSPLVSSFQFLMSNLRICDFAAAPSQQMILNTFAPNSI